MSRSRSLLLVPSLLLLVGCYAARIETGLPPSTKVIRQPFASSWIYGLVPPKTVTTAAECPNGVAIVETQLSFLNQVVGFLTLGIYTPMQIVVTCAEKPSMGMADPSLDLTIPQGSSQEDVQALFSHAADEAVRLKRPVRVGRE